MNSGSEGIAVTVMQATSGCLSVRDEGFEKTDPRRVVHDRCVQVSLGYEYHKTIRLYVYDMQCSIIPPCTTQHAIQYRHGIMQPSYHTRNPQINICCVTSHCTNGGPADKSQAEASPTFQIEGPRGRGFPSLWLQDRTAGFGSWAHSESKAPPKGRSLSPARHMNVSCQSSLDPSQATKVNAVRVGGRHSAAESLSICFLLVCGEGQLPNRCSGGGPEVLHTWRRTRMPVEGDETLI